MPFISVRHQHFTPLQTDRPGRRIQPVQSAGMTGNKALQPVQGSVFVKQGRQTRKSDGGGKYAGGASARFLGMDGMGGGVTAEA